jgi:hypothetical protein
MTLSVHRCKGDSLRCGPVVINPKAIQTIFRLFAMELGVKNGQLNDERVTLF